MKLKRRESTGDGFSFKKALCPEQLREEQLKKWAPQTLNRGSESGHTVEGESEKSVSEAGGKEKKRGGERRALRYNFQ